MHSGKATDKGANSIQIICAIQEQLQSTSGKTKSDLLAFIRQGSLIGNLMNEERFTKLFSEMVQKNYADNGIKKLMKQAYFNKRSILANIINSDLLFPENELVIALAVFLVNDFILSENACG